ncbi:uncharacterized protein LOC123546354 [Mercenaria mercenaria]|uniref:uncharacterized protein LOC123546354 n=1 Tax=Mercenaria mercenaria TaxID=6596 RepID=UPI00234F5A00|nr:uncharacterized protein LOC123546354 [Mercenaria mercenaria]
MSGSENRKSGRPTTRHDYGGKVNEIGFGDDDTGNPSKNSDSEDGASAVFSPVRNKKDETLALLQSQLQSLDQEEEELRKDAEITKLQKRIEQKKKSVADLRESDSSSEASGSESNKPDSEKVSKEKKPKKNKKKSKKSSGKYQNYEDDSSSDETSSSDSSSSKESKRKHKKHKNKSGISAKSSDHVKYRQQDITE